ncbi:unnamed protein product [Rotaria socialis]|uniref:Uncharacterized protein n=1 Tax=Rotaria socialis TaxID=392032 RepID=A0A820AEK6_9BILA|nr:unnamed protein product [Rotaria socialis]
MCLHSNGRFYSLNSAEELLKLDLQMSIGIYYIWEPDDDESDEDNRGRIAGHGDFYIYNLMLLLILPSLSSMTTALLGTIGYIVIVQICNETTVRLGFLYDQDRLSGLSLSIQFYITKTIKNDGAHADVCVNRMIDEASFNSYR